MSDSYPESFSIEIERQKLCRYLRCEALVTALLPCLIFGTYFGAIWGSRRRGDGPTDLWTTIPLGMAIGFSVGLVVALVLYIVLGHFTGRLRANRLEVSVVGPYLRIVEGVVMRRDRKLHFRSIVDYSCFAGPLMRVCGVGGIMLTTMAGGQAGTVRIRGVKDALVVRDMLSEIDCLREER
jgi:hypothetical protein